MDFDPIPGTRLVFYKWLHDRHLSGLIINTMNGILLDTPSAGADMMSEASMSQGQS